ncbi:hypothetical protein B0H10DRAFT_599747 [Mycena sp. CBHHK59/15]|nr:hypothetical protein B0H10DRAFT_599747 [Mycena sp. CBHHK59/15]
MPIDLPYGLDPVSLSPSAFTTCTSSRSFLPGGATLFRFPAPPVPCLSLVHLHSCYAAGEFGGGATSSISFLGRCLFVYDLRYFRPCPHIVLYQSMHLRYILIPNRSGMHLVNEFCTPV